MNNPYNILLVEDNPGDERLVVETLVDTSLTIPVLDKAACLADALELVSNHEYDVIMLDLGLPDSTGLDTVRSILSAAGNHAVVVLSGLSDQDVALEAVKMGAQDYLSKGDLGPDVLERVVRYAKERAIQREHTSMLSRVVEETMTGIFLIDHRGMVQYANRSANTFPVFREPISGPCTDEQSSMLATECLIDPIDAMVNHTMSTHLRSTRRLSVTSAEGATRHIECTTYPHTHATGGHHWTVVQLIDVTEEVRSTDGLIRTHRLEFLGKMSGEVAHEFNNQMAVIAGHLDAMQTPDADPSIHQHIDACKHSIHHLSKKVGELQAIASRQINRPTRQDLTAALTSHVERLRQDLKTHQRIQWQPDRAMPIVFDRDQLDFVLSTILESPFRRNADESVRIHLALNMEPSGQERACLQVLIRTGNDEASDGLHPERASSKRVASDPTVEMGEFDWDTAAVEGIMRQMGGSFEMETSGPTKMRLDLCFPTNHGYAV